MPVIRFAGLYPAHAVIRPPSDPSLVPPVVAYHDLRVLAEAAGLRRSQLDVPAVRAIAAHSLDQLRIRRPRTARWSSPTCSRRRRSRRCATVNHPGNPIWTALAARVRAALGRPEHAVDPGRPLLDSVHAPREAAVLEAWGLDEPERPHWVVAGRTVEAGAVREAHLAWYARHPDAVRAGLVRHADALRLLGVS